MTASSAAAAPSTSAAAAPSTSAAAAAADADDTDGSDDSDKEHEATLRTYDIVVKRPDAPSLTVQVTQETSVSIFKQRVADAWGIHVRAFRLYHSKKGIDGEGYRRVLEWSPGIIEQGVEVVLKLSGGAGSKRSAGGSKRGGKPAAVDKEELANQLKNNVMLKQTVVDGFNDGPMVATGAKVGRLPKG